MTTMINPHPNGRKRPSLGEQINRVQLNSQHSFHAAFFRVNG